MKGVIFIIAILAISNACYADGWAEKYTVQSIAYKEGDLGHQTIVFLNPVQGSSCSNQQIRTLDVSTKKGQAVLASLLFAHERKA